MMFLPYPEPSTMGSSAKNKQTNDLFVQSQDHRRDLGVFVNPDLSIKRASHCPAICYFVNHFLSGMCKHTLDRHPSQVQNTFIYVFWHGDACVHLHRRLGMCTHSPILCLLMVGASDFPSHNKKQEGQNFYRSSPCIHCCRKKYCRAESWTKVNIATKAIFFSV